MKRFCCGVVMLISALCVATGYGLDHELIGKYTAEGSIAACVILGLSVVFAPVWSTFFD